MFQASSSYFSYEPVLRCLKSIVTVPFEDELVSGQAPADLSEVSTYALSDAIREKLVSDTSQLHAVESALTKRLTLVQGPPGTGRCRHLCPS